jgi:Ca-activated chloride channel homolog
LAFENPWVWPVVAVVGLLCASVWAWTSQRQQKRRTLLVSAQLSTLFGFDGVQQRRAAAWFAGALAALAAALTLPQCGATTTVLPRKGLDVLFVIDVSRSMRAKDTAPDRLQRVKAEVQALLPRIADNRVGLVAFAGTAFVQCPLTTDTDAFLLFLQALSPETVPQGGTSVAAGIDVAVNAFLSEEATSGRMMVVFSDGEDHEGGLDGLAKRIRDARIDAVIVGVGGTQGQPVPVLDDDGAMRGYLQDRNGKTVMTKMDPDALSAIATGAGGVFIDGGGRADLGMSDVVARLANLEKRDLAGRTHVKRQDRKQILLLASLLCVCAGLWLLMPRRQR